MSTESVQDKTGERINEGDYVYTKYRGGTHEGEVDKVVTDDAEAHEEEVANPPKVSKAPAVQTRGIKIMRLTVPFPSSRSSFTISMGIV
ncbi:hypothetical protein AbraIFM66950_000713 [Aspergillus brasiliensis]|nr:hypothetical protein AbraIFM66950_000713 [Aspergillus brasiliensis]